MTPKFGLVLFGRDLGTSALTDVGAGTRDSEYDESDPGPGHPEPEEDGSSYRPQILQAQSVDLVVRTMRGGYPGRDSATTHYRLDGEGANDLRSWEDPVLIKGWTAPADGWGGSQAYDAFAAAVVKETGIIVITALVTSTGDAQTWSYNPRTRTWTTGYDWDAGVLDGLVRPIGMAYDPQKQVILLWSGFNADGARQQTAYYSVDEGASWTPFARAFATGLSSGWDATGIFRPVIGTDLDWLMIGNEVVNGLGADNAAHFASSDRGVTWDLITDTGTAGRSGSPMLGPAGYVYVYVDPTNTNALTSRIASHARATFDSEVVIDDSVEWSAVWACADDDGILYAVARGDSGGTTFGDFYAFRSTDGGLSWERYGWGVWSSNSSTRTLEPHLLVASCGQLHLIGTTVGSTNTDGTVNLVTLGGWSQVAHGAGTTNYIRTPLHRFGYGVDDPDAAASAWTMAYLPIAMPNNLGWTAGAATGTASLTDAEPAFHLSTTAGQAIDYFVAAPHSAAYAACEFEVKLNSSGNVSLATLGSAGDGVYVKFLLSSGAYYYEVRFDIGTTGIQLVDTNPAGSPTIRATATLNPRAQYTRVRLHLTKGNAAAWVSTDGGVVWDRFATNVTVSNSAAFAAGADGIFWGIASAQVGDAFFRFVGAGAAVDWQYGFDGIGAIGDSPADGPLGHNFGHPVPGRGSSYPIPEGTDTDEELALLSATGGPTHQGELVDLPVAYAHGVDQADPLLFPSPRRTWRNTGGGILLVYDQGAAQHTWYGGALALLVIGCPRYWALQRDDGSTGWETLGTLDLALGSSLKWTRVGRTILPATGTATISGRIGENALAGGTFDLDNNHCRRILRNSPGYWTDSAAHQQVRITLDGVTGAEASSGTAGVLCAPGGILIAYPSADTPRRYLAVSVTGPQITPDNRYEAGIVAVGRVVGLSTPSWGQSSRLAVSRTYATAADGVTTATQLGPPRRQVSYSWSDAAPLVEIRTAVASPSTIQATGGVPIGHHLNQVDLPALVEQLESGALPCALVTALPATTGTVLDPTLWVYGRLSGIDLSLTGSAGTEGTDEAVTVGGITVEEIR